MIALTGLKKSVVAMAHLPPLPGSPLYDRAGGMARIQDLICRDIEALQEGGVDAIMFGNEGDRPYLLKSTPESLAAMAVCVAQILPTLRVPFGVNYLWDPVATVALAHATGARFAREVFTGVYDSDMGLWQPDAAAALRLRANLGSETKLLFNINAEFAAPLGQRDTTAKARSVVFSSLADAICVSGPMTGETGDVSTLAAVKRAVGDVPVFANTGVNRDNITDIFRHADGVVVGTHLKRDGVTWNAVDPERVKRFMDVVAGLR
ncbi:BtpA/SgcQ family protein [Roseococcus pinisoli]|uniref:BtpA/SgcQ family protein n=1 Tax=Roseococcus pinisoli TaxID=2835040 RepID=A0ABS5QDU9_9PROT|nr:BtpA/SgcQ family protein [Roseococcus pinisoli]MBS7811874.1 BtpA/SgcQ family protein [Roseococcus pinisoli]